VARVAKNKINPKQLLFVQEYLKDFNGTQAAIRAGYSKKAAKQIASELLLGNGEVQKVIEELKKTLIEQGGYNLEAAVKELDENIALAKSNKNMMAVSKMLETKIKIHGLLEDVLRLKVEKVDVVGALEEAQKRVREANSVESAKDVFPQMEFNSKAEA
jgi:phage terminase small subunit